jgi:hypothetical protein
MATQERRDWLDVYGEEYRQRGLYIVAAHYDPATGMIHAQLKAGMTISVPKERVQGLVHASNEQLSEVEISPGGWSFVFPRIDDGVSLEGLLSGRFGNDRWEQEWAEKHRETKAA